MRDLVNSERLRRGDHAAFTRIVAAHQAAVIRVARFVARDEAAALDAAQETFLRLWRKPGAFRGGSLRAWLCTVVRNVALNELRSQRRFRDRSPPQQSPRHTLPSPETQAAGKEDLARVREFIDSFPDRERMSILLNAIEGFSQREVAQILGATPAAVKQAVLAARTKLRQQFLDPEAR